MATRALQRRRRNPGAATWLSAHRWELLGAGLVLGAVGIVWPFLDPEAPQWLPINWLTGGSKVDDIEAPKAGWIDQDPTSMADAAGVDVETYSLARAMRSEGGTSADKRIWTGWAMLNHARRSSGGDITATVTGPRKAPAAGFYGAQNVPTVKGQPVRYVSTARPPRSEDITLAQGIQAGTIADPTGGAEFFFEPGLQDSAIGKIAGYTQGSKAHIDSMVASGYEVVEGPGGLILFRRASGGSLTS